MKIDPKRWADRWHAEQRCTAAGESNRDRKAVQFWIDLCRAVVAADKADASAEPEQPAPDPAGDVPMTRTTKDFATFLRWKMESNPELKAAIEDAEAEHAEVESEIARRVAEATDWLRAEIERLKAQLAKWESEPVGKLITDLRDQERESKNQDIAKLKAELAEIRKSYRIACESLADNIDLMSKRTEERDAARNELAEATKPVELWTVHTREIDGVKMIYLGDAQAVVRSERNARLSVEQRLALTREAWRHRWVDGCSNGKMFVPRTEADIDAAIEAHEKTKADAAGGGE